jgi:phosphatidylinositol 4-kinase
MAAEWNLSPSLALAFGLRFPAVDAVQSYLVRKIASTATDPSIQILPKAVRYLISSAEQSKFSLLSSWATVGLSEAIHLMTMPSGRHPLVVKYVLRSLQSCDPEEIAFFLPQLVQSLRHDPDGLIERFLLEEGRHSVYFAYLLESQLASEGTPPSEAFNPSVKRSNWSPPVDTGLWTTADRVRDKLWKTMTDEVGKVLQAEVAFFKEVTDVSGKLYPIPKADRKSAAEEFTSNIAMPEQPIFMPTDSHARVISIKPESATPMQSAAKCPILVAFEVEKTLPGQNIPATMVDAAIFKVGDDCRQDLLALQVIALLKKQFDSARLHLPLVPYGVVPTGHECGIIQVVPRAKSRAQLVRRKINKYVLRSMVLCLD